MTDIQTKIESFQNLLIEISTGDDQNENDFVGLRKEIIEIKSLLPEFFQIIRKTKQF